MAHQAHTRAQDCSDAAALLETLDFLRSAITIFDAQGRLLYANAHLNHLFRSFPPHAELIGKSYQDLIRLEIKGGEIAPAALAGGTRLSAMTRHMLGLFRGVPGARAFRRHLAMQAVKPDAGAQVLRDALALLADADRDATPRAA